MVMERLRKDAFGSHVLAIHINAEIELERAVSAII